MSISNLSAEFIREKYSRVNKIEDVKEGDYYFYKTEVIPLSLITVHKLDKMQFDLVDENIFKRYEFYHELNKKKKIG